MHAAFDIFKLLMSSNNFVNIRKQVFIYLKTFSLRNIKLICASVIAKHIYTLTTKQNKMPYQ